MDDSFTVVVLKRHLSMIFKSKYAVNQLVCFFAFDQ